MLCKRVCNAVKQKKTFPSHQQEWNNNYLNYFHGDRNEDSQIAEGLAGGWELFPSGVMTSLFGFQFQVAMISLN